MTVKEALRKEQLKELAKMKKTFEAERLRDPDFAADLGGMIRRLEHKLGL